MSPYGKKNPKDMSRAELEFEVTWSRTRIAVLENAFDRSSIAIPPEPEPHEVHGAPV